MQPLLHPAHLVLLDATSAYDVVPVDVVGLAFARLGAPKQFTDWLAAATTGHRRLVRTTGGISETPFALSGLPQGCPLSPPLWTSIVDIALTYARKRGGEGYEILSPDDVQNTDHRRWGKAGPLFVFLK